MSSSPLSKCLCKCKKKKHETNEKCKTLYDEQTREKARNSDDAKGLKRFTRGFCEMAFET